MSRCEIASVVLVSVLLGWLSPASRSLAAPDVRLPELKGAYIGMSEDELRSLMPEFECAVTPRYFSDFELTPRRCAASSTTIAGEPAHASALFRDGKMEVLTFHLEAQDSFSLVEQALRRKYGAPSVDAVSRFVTKGGDSGSGPWLYWDFGNGHHLVAKEHFYFRDTAAVRILSSWAATELRDHFLAPPRPPAAESDL